MSLGSVLSNLILGPLRLLFEAIFSYANRMQHAGLSIAILSLAVHLLTRPLYQRAEEIQRMQREQEKKLAPMVEHIRRMFRGNERFMILQAYYRENHYSQMSALKGVLPLLLQIPFFVAAYQFLSRLVSLQGATLGPIADLSRPDGLLRVGTTAVNLLPILMTAVNLLSGALYLKGSPFRAKAQVFLTALVFLVLLYSSPSGLVFYWTLNNVLSLLQNLCRTIRSPGTGEKRRLLKYPQGKPRFSLFLLFGILSTVLVGLLIPSAVIASSPQEFIWGIDALHPAWYVVNAFLLAAGTFLLWGGIYYALGSPVIRKGLEYAWAAGALIFLADYFFFQKGLGLISTGFLYETAPRFSTGQKVLNLAVLSAVAFGTVLLCAKKEKWARGLALVLSVALLGMTGWNLQTIQQSCGTAYASMKRNFQGEPEIPMSREGKNVVVLMLDRAISAYIPAVLHENPALRETYSGFRYYPNTISFGAHTKVGAPAIFGGYEYTPLEINRRDQESRKDKHNEALLLMPTLFSREGYEITAFDMPYPGNYTEIGDYSLYDDLPHTNARDLENVVADRDSWYRQENLRLRNLFCYSLTRVAPEAAFAFLYDYGNYNYPEMTTDSFTARPENQKDRGTGNTETDPVFSAEFGTLKSLPEMTRVRSDVQGTLLLMVNETTHTPILLREPEYEPGSLENNAAYDAAHQDRFLAGPHELHMTEDVDMAHYQVNMAALIQIGKWLENLKEQGVYHNTRIIIVADHGYDLGEIDEGILGFEQDMMHYNPLLLVKDFDATGDLATDSSFMTNADVPTLAMEGLIENPVNPFTHKPVSSAPKNGQICISATHAPEIYQAFNNTFPLEDWYVLTPPEPGETLYDLSRWQYISSMDEIPPEEP